ncbi:MAG: PEP-CTERM sorting domain-containing protein, partial [Pirellulales bacterium]|nr:PEP-CTERM sorting domain-containing protein [Pirellulales bacterium]
PNSIETALTSSGTITGRYFNGFGGGAGNGIVDFTLTADFTTNTGQFHFQTAAIPEPSSFALLATGTGVLAFRRRRRRR